MRSRIPLTRVHEAYVTTQDAIALETSGRACDQNWFRVLEQQDGMREYSGRKG